MFTEIQNTHKRVEWNTSSWGVVNNHYTHVEAKKLPKVKIPILPEANYQIVDCVITFERLNISGIITMTP